MSPKYIAFKRGGMIAALASVFVMPWHLFNRPVVIHFTLDTLGAAIGPLYGILVADYFIVKRDELYVDDLFRDGPTAPTGTRTASTRRRSRPSGLPGR